MDAVKLIVLPPSAQVIVRVFEAKVAENVDGFGGKVPASSL
jgi:hypothetical protein